MLRIIFGSSGTFQIKIKFLQHVYIYIYLHTKIHLVSFNDSDLVVFVQAFKFYSGCDTNV